MAAGLPPCSGLHGKGRATCRRLEALATRYAAAVERVKDVATALSTTADRVSGANGAGNAKAAKKQTKQAARLVRRFVCFFAAFALPAPFAPLTRSAVVDRAV